MSLLSDYPRFKSELHKELTSPPIVGSAATPNFLETNYTGGNNNIRFEQVGATNPTVQILGFGGGPDPILVSVVGATITVSIQIDFGDVVPTAQDVINFLNADSGVAALVSVSNVAGSDGSGDFSTPVSFGPTALSGSEPAVPGTPADFVFQYALDTVSGLIWQCNQITPYYFWYQVSALNSAVSVDAFILPPQVYVDNVEYAVRTAVSMAGGAIIYFDLALKGMSHFDLNGAFAAAGAPPNIYYFSVIDVSGNNLDSGEVIKFFSDIALCISNNPVTSCSFYTHGPNMGCPLNVPGTVGGWVIDATGVDPSGGFEVPYITTQYYPEAWATITSSIFDDFSSSYVSGSVINIGIQDSPTLAQVLAKIAELYPEINPDGSIEVVGDTLVYTDTVPRLWFLDSNIPYDASGTNPSSADIDYLITQSCTGSFTGPDGVTQINF